VNKYIFYFLFFLLSNCSLDQKSGIWTKNEKIKNDDELVIKELFKKSKALENEYNLNVKIRLESFLVNNNIASTLDNNSGRLKYNGILKNISRYKFSKIDNFNQFEPEMIFDGENIIFFDNKGSILKFDKFSKLIWKKNYYTKSEKKLSPSLTFAIIQNKLLVVDNLSKYYAINVDNGELLWTKKSKAPSNSQIKIYKDDFLIVDFHNILRCISINDGIEKWNVSTDTTFIKSQKKLSLIISRDKVFFNNSIGDISAVDIKSGNLIWQTPTQSSSIYENAFLLKTSDLVTDNKSILFSNNRNEFFSLDIFTGAINWQKKINSTIRPVLIDKLIFTISNEGFLVILDKDSGEIARITNIFSEIKEKKRKNIIPVGFIVGVDNIYLTTSHGRLIIINILKGKTSSILKIANKKISRPFILNENLFIIKDNSIIKLN